MELVVNSRYRVSQKMGETFSLSLILFYGSIHA